MILRLAILALAMGMMACVATPETLPDEQRPLIDAEQAREATEHAVRKTRRGIEEIANRPLVDLNMRRDEIPISIRDLESYTDDKNALNCVSVREEIDALNDALGVEGPRQAREKTLARSVSDRAAEIVIDTVEEEAGALVPFRSTIRKISGADAYERRRRTAVSLGKQRRAYLRGAWAAMACEQRLAIESGIEPARGAPRSLIDARSEDQVETAPLEPIMSVPSEAPTSSQPNDSTTPPKAEGNSRRILPSLG